MSLKKPNSIPDVELVERINISMPIASVGIRRKQSLTVNYRNTAGGNTIKKPNGD